jgi:hypothetical protein
VLQSCVLTLQIPVCGDRAEHKLRGDIHVRRIGLELDGKDFHDYERDKARDIALWRDHCNGQVQMSASG